MRIMGKRQIGQLQPFELVIAILIADLAAVPMQNTGIPLINGVVPIITLLLAQVSISFITLKSEKARAIICGTPNIVIENGKIREDELKRMRFDLNDLIEQLRSKNIYNISDVEFAIMETTGHLSVIVKSQKRAVTPEDMQLETQYEGIPLTLILDGRINHKNLSLARLNVSWLMEQISLFGYDRIEQIFFASLDTQGKLFLQAKI